MNRSAQLGLFKNSQTLFRGRSVKAVTFKGNFDYPIHRWFRLTASFSPELVGDVLDHWQLPRGGRVLDPFCGVGTTLVVCQERGFEGTAVEINPLLQFVARVKTSSCGNCGALSQDAAAVIRAAERGYSEYREVEIHEFLNRYALAIPAISNVTKWWSPSVLKKLVALRSAIIETRIEEGHRPFLLLAAMAFLIEVSNARHNHPSLSFAKTPRLQAPVFERFERQVSLMVLDLKTYPGIRSRAQVFLGNSRNLGDVLAGGDRFDAVITSPPYPNRFSYARETRPHLFFLGLVKDGRQVGELETESIGGTWGQATSVLNGRFEYSSDVVRRALRGIPEHVGEHSLLMKNYIIKYFNNLSEHAGSLIAYLQPRAKLAYVIGNSMFYGIPLPSDEILAEIFEARGCELRSIERMRRRNCKTGLYEAVVFMEYHPRGTKPSSVRSEQSRRPP
jgi:hypothetical protein